MASISIVSVQVYLELCIRIDRDTFPVYYFQSIPEQLQYAKELHERVRREFPEVSVYADANAEYGMTYKPIAFSFVSIGSGKNQSVSPLRPCHYK